MNIYYISQDENNDYDTYDSMVVVANSEEEAKQIHPRRDGWIDNIWNVWASSPERVKVELVGTASNKYREPGIILASFNAG